MRARLIALSALPLTAAFAAATLAGPASGAEGTGKVPPPPWTIPAATSFAYGVAAGEVRQTSAVLWGRAGQAGTVTLVVARDSALANVVHTRDIESLPTEDFIVQAVVEGLTPGTAYYYGFTLGGDRSEVGRFQTAPRTKDRGTVSFAFSGDAQATPDPDTGRPFFNNFEVFDRMADEDNDFNILQGDTIYSDTQVGGEVDGVELISPWVARTVEEKWSVYRQNLALDPMARFRSSASLFSHWDDHEFINNFTVPDDGEELFDAGKEAFLDYTPLRGFDDSVGLYRTQRWGKNLQIFFLDQSSFRSQLAEGPCTNPLTGKPDPAPTLPSGMRALYKLLVPPMEWTVSQECLDAIADPSRTMLGDAQFERFIADLDASTATFKVVMLQEPIQEVVINQYDRWESYTHARTELLTAIRRVAPKNLIFLTTDLHANLIGDVRMRTFGGKPIPTPYKEVVAGPIAATTHRYQIVNAYDRPKLADMVRDLFYTAPVDPRGQSGGLGMTCANLDTYAYGQVTVTSTKLTVTLKDLDGKRVLSEGGSVTAKGKPCPVVTLRAK